MPNVLVVPGVCRFTIKGLWTNSRPVDNIVDMHIFNRDPDTSREVAINDQGAIILDNWVSDVMPDLTNNYSVGSISWVDLDTEDGVTGSYVYPGGATGSDTGGEATPNVALLIHKVIGSTARGKRPGRMYVSGLTEGAIDANGLIAGDFSSDFEAWRGDINQDAGLTGPGYDSRLCVVHGANSAPVAGVITGSFTHVTALVQDTHAATQRRRLRK